MNKGPFKGSRHSLRAASPKTKTYSGEALGMHPANSPCLGWLNATMHYVGSRPVLEPSNRKIQPTNGHHPGVRPSVAVYTQAGKISLLL
jgi:hypothetical protein